VAGARSGGDDEGGGEDERAAGAGAGAEALAEQEDAEQRTDEGLHVEQDAGLGCGDLGDSPVPEQGGGCGAEQAAGGEGEPDLQGDDCDGRRAEGLTIEERDDEEEHRGAGGDSVGGDGDRTVALHQALVDEDPGEGDDQGEDDEQVAGEGGAGWIEGLAGGGAVSAEGDERGAEGGDGESEPADPVHSLVGEESCADGQDDRHGAHHQRGVGDGGEGEAGELDEELEGDSKEGGEQQEAPVRTAEAGPMEQEKRGERECGEEETVEDHCADVHLCQGELAEVEAAAPEGAGEGAGCEAESAVFNRLRHIDGRS